MDKSKLHKTPLSLGVKIGNTLSYAVFCNYCDFEIQECPDIKSIKLLRNVIQEIIEVNPIGKYTQTNWKNWIKASRLIILGFNDVWEKLNKIRQNYFRKTIQDGKKLMILTTVNTNMIYLKNYGTRKHGMNFRNHGKKITEKDKEN
jgi:hypothetical protein